MEPWEIMISESQERMVAVVAPGAWPRSRRSAPLGARPRGDRRGDRRRGELRAFFDGELVGAIPAPPADRRGAALRGRAAARAAAPSPRRRRRPPTPRPCSSCSPSPNVRSRAWVYRRYDHLVGSRTVRRPGLDAAVLRLRPSFRGLAVSLDGSGRIARLDPNTGGARAVLEAARNVACAGGEPLAITDCLNFGNPEKPEVAWELAEAIEGMAAACEALGIPVVSGNVSLYNETDGRAIHPTPVVGCVGLVPDVRAIPGSWREGDAIVPRRRPPVLLRRLRVPGALRRARRPARRSTSPPRRRSSSFLYDAAPAARSCTTSPRAGWRSHSPRPRSQAASAPSSTWPTSDAALFGEGGGQASRSRSGARASTCRASAPSAAYSPRRPRSTSCGRPGR